MIDVPVWIIWSAFGLSLTGAVAIFGLSALSAWRSDFQFFPPPSNASWQHRTFLALFSFSSSIPSRTTMSQKHSLSKTT